MTYQVSKQSSKRHNALLTSYGGVRYRSPQLSGIVITELATNLIEADV